MNFHDLLFMSDLSAKLIGIMDGNPTQVFVDITDSDTGEKILEKGLCYQIIDTNRWACSLAMFSDSDVVNISYHMYGDDGSSYWGDFVLRKGE